MRRLSAAAEQVSRNITRAPYLPELAERSDEVGQMAGAFEAMTAALYRRIEASENFAADVAHELKNPLTAARSTAESLGLRQERGAALAPRPADPGRAEAPQPAHHGRVQRLAPRRRARTQGDAPHRRAA